MADADAWLRKVFGRLPSLDDLAGRFGEQTVIGVANRVLAERVAAVEDATERLGIGSNCHICGDAREKVDPFYDFGLAGIVSTKKNWAGAVGTLALNALTVPLGVVVAPRGIGSTTTANIARCRLVLCNACGQQHRNWLGTLKITAEDCSKHPSWARLVAAGHSKFLDQEELGRYRPAS